MKTISININLNSSKADEVAFLRRLAKAIPDGTYLKALFTPALLGWVEQEISGDFTPDIMGRLDWVEKTTRDEAARQHAADSAEIARLKNALDETSNTLYDARREFGKLQRTNESLNQTLDRVTNSRNLKNAENAELRKALDEQQAQVVALQENITAVKVLAANKLLGIDTTAADSQSEILRTVLETAKEQVAHYDQIYNDASEASYRKDGALTAACALRNLLQLAGIDA